ncbi:hypothetical protein Tco_0118198, partial [Tanacetum coccineum]
MLVDKMWQEPTRLVTMKEGDMMGLGLTVKCRNYNKIEHTTRNCKNAVAATATQGPQSRIRGLLLALSVEGRDTTGMTIP